MRISVQVSWDSETKVWIAINDDIGLSLESDSYDTLLEHVRMAVPELIELNHLPKCSSISFSS